MANKISIKCAGIFESSRLYLTMLEGIQSSCVFILYFEVILTQYFEFVYKLKFKIMLFNHVK